MSEATDLMTLAAPPFGQLSRAEREVLEGAVTGLVAYCGPSHDDNDPLNDPANSNVWDPERHVRAKLLRWLCADEGANKLIDPRGLRVHGAVILDELSLSFLKVPFQLGLLHCRVKGTLRFNLTEIPRIDLTGSWIESVRGDHLVVKGDIVLKSAVCIGHQVELAGARIGGRLNCDGARLENPLRPGVETSGIALIAEAIRVGGSVFFREPFSAHGLVRLFNAQIEGNIECDGAQFANPAQPGVERSGTAFDIEGADVGASVYLRGNQKKGGRDFSAKGLVLLYRAKIGGNLVCDGGSFDNAAQPNIESTGNAINANAVRFGGSVFLRSGVYGRRQFSATGSVLLNGAQIGGNLECNGGRIINPAQAGMDKTGFALLANAVNVAGMVLLCKGFHAYGTVALYSAQIGGDLNCDGGTFENAAQKDVPNSGMALNAEGAKIGGSLLCRSGFFGRGKFSARGTVRMYNAEIERNLECDGGKFENPTQAGVKGSGSALMIEAVRVEGSVYMRGGFLAIGMVQLSRAQVGGIIDCSRGKFQNAGAGGLAGIGTALSAVHLKATRDILLATGFEAEGAVLLNKAQIGGRLQTNGGKFHNLDLGDASAGAIVDDVDGDDWRPSARFNLDGFTYKRIGKEVSRDPLDQAIEEAELPREIANIPHRLQWLESQSKFARQPYLQLAKVLKDEGDSKGFRKVSIRMEERARSGQSWWRRFGGHLLRLTIGYGYSSQRAVYWLLGLILVGSLVYWHGCQNMVPTDKDALNSVESGEELPVNYGRFHALAYSIDNSFPLVKLGMQDKWTPREAAPREIATAGSWLEWIDWSIASPGFLRYFRWCQICVGWLLTSLFFVGLTGLIRKD